MSRTISRELAAKVYHTVMAGLVHGLGQPAPGQMCVQAAVNYSMRQLGNSHAGHHDRPSCVGEFMIGFGISLNDRHWSSIRARADGMKGLAVAELGSNKLDQDLLRRMTAFHIVQSVWPRVLRLRGTAWRKLAAEAEALTSYNDAERLAGQFSELSGILNNPLHILNYIDNITHGQPGCKDQLLIAVADAGVQALIDMESDGSGFLDLVDTDDGKREPP